MARPKIKPDKPSLAGRVDQDVYNFYVRLAKKRSEYISNVVETALVKYKKETEHIEAYNEKEIL